MYTTPSIIHYKLRNVSWFVRSRLSLTSGRTVKSSSATMVEWPPRKISVPSGFTLSFPFLDCWGFEILSTKMTSSSDKSWVWAFFGGRSSSSSSIEITLQLRILFKGEDLVSRLSEQYVSGAGDEDSQCLLGPGEDPQSLLGPGEDRRRLLWGLGRLQLIVSSICRSISSQLTSSLMIFGAIFLAFSRFLKAWHCVNQQMYRWNKMVRSSEVGNKWTHFKGTPQGLCPQRWCILEFYILVIVWLETHCNGNPTKIFRVPFTHAYRRWVLDVVSL